MFEKLEILQVFHAEDAEPARRAISFAAKLAEYQGAKIVCSGDPDLGSNPFYDSDATSWEGANAGEWATAPAPDGAFRIVLTTKPGIANENEIASDYSAVFLDLENWHSEETLFAVSGLAELLGDPDREPIVPAAHYAAHSMGYAIFAAMTAIHAGQRRFQQQETAIVSGSATLAWVNWKAGAAAAMGQNLSREGSKAEWPVLKCADGYAAFVFTERDWAQIVKMVGAPELEDERFKNFKGRQADRDGYMDPIRHWALSLTKAELAETFYKHAIPGAPVATPADLLNDPLLAHRKAFKSVQMQNGDSAQIPVPPSRIVEEVTSGEPTAQPVSSGQHQLPLSGIRVLDLGIITAGAGVSALLADMGAEVIKVESKTYPDPFRQWAGATDVVSPLFKFNNRNKTDIDLDLKTENGRTTFLELAKTADVVVENFRRGVLDRLGLTFDALREANPNILLASISGQGIDGQYADHTTFGSTLEANSGFAALACYEDGMPYITGRNVNYPDQIVCLYGAAAICAAVTDCKEKGIARHLDTSQRDCAMYQLGDILAEVSTGLSDAPNDVRSRIQKAGVSGVVRCSDGDHVAFSCDDTQTLKKVPGLPGIDVGSVAAWAAQQPSAEVCEMMLSCQVGAASVATGKAVMTNPADQGALIFATSPSGDLVKGFPFQLSTTPMTITRDAPAVGEHNHLYLPI